MDDVVRTGKMSGVTAGENALPVIDGMAKAKASSETLRAHEWVHGGDPAGAGAVT